MITIIINDAPYGDEKPYNALRLALSLVKSETQVLVFLMADAVSCGIKNQQTPNGYYNIGRMINGLVKRGFAVHVWGSCSDARGVSEEMLIDGIVKSNMDTLAEWIKGSVQTLVF